jgi:Fic family protein
VKPPKPPTPLHELLKKLPKSRFEQIFAHESTRSIGALPYLPWDKVRYSKPPDGLTHEEWWLVLKIARAGMRREVPLRDKQGASFSYALPDEALRLLHKIDQYASGQIQLSEAVTNSATRDRYIVNSLIEEAITSSQLEGASTTRQVAKEMIRSGRAPRDKSEKMIVNNYAAMLYARDAQHMKLTPELVLELHRIVTDGTLENPEAAGRLQRTSDDRVGVYDDEGTLLHSPPPAAELDKRLTLMCAFANGEVGQNVYIHPVAKAIILHFWLGYDHPFEDGNGRTARALFYWSMLSQGYWLTEFLSISRILKKAPSQYARSFLYTETDDNDLTYFLLYQLKVISRSIEELQEYLRQKMAEIRDVKILTSKSVTEFNQRQLALLTQAMHDESSFFTISSHSRSHRISQETSRKDLRELQDRGLLRKEKQGKRFVYVPMPDISVKLQEL